MAKRQEIGILLQPTGEPATWSKVTAEMVGEQWGIYKNDNKRYVVTHVPSGKMVDSFALLKDAKLLCQEPEFFDLIDENNPEDLARLAKALKRFRDKNGWK